MKRILFTMLLAASLSAEAQTQTYETELSTDGYTEPFRSPFEI